MTHRDVDGSDKSFSYRHKDIDWDEGEESDVDREDGSKSELDVGQEVLDDDRDFLARDDSGEEHVISRFTVSSTQW